jgi:hypothetical protein
LGQQAIATQQVAKNYPIKFWAIFIHLRRDHKNRKLKGKIPSPEKSIIGENRVILKKNRYNHFK